MLFQTDHKADALVAKLLLESKGIPAFIGSERSGQLLGGIFSSTYSLWVELDHQYDDAMAILDDPEQHAADPVSIDEYNAFKQRWQRRFDARMRTAGRSLALVAVLLAIWILMSTFLRGIGSG
jgi:hypothetical protein